MSAVEGAQNRRLDNADSKDRRQTGWLGLGGAGERNNNGIELYKGVTFIQKLTRKLGAVKGLLLCSGENDILFMGS